MVKQEIKKYAKVLIFIGLILLTIWLVYKLFNGVIAEPFEINTDKKYGNLIAYSTGNKNDNEYKVATKRVIYLPGRFKLTGFKISGVVLSQVTVTIGTEPKQIWLFSQNPSSIFNDINANQVHTISIGTPAKSYYAFKDMQSLSKLYPGETDNIAKFTDSNKTEYYALTRYNEPTFKLSLVNNAVDINNLENHVNVVIDNTSDLKLNQDYNTYSYFDNEDKSAKFAGNILIITQSYADSLVTRPVYLTGWEVYGLAPYSPSWVDYSVMNKIYTGANSIKDNETIDLSGDKKVFYIELTGNSANAHTAYNITLQYKNSLDNLTNVYSINGPVQLAFSNSSQYIFLDEVIIASQIIIKSSLNGKNVKVNVYGGNASQNDINTFKLEQGKYDSKGIIVEGQKCPNVGQMMKKQLQAQQICEALEQKDRIRNKKASYERDKAYLKKLAEQDGEIKMLANKITDLIEKKNARIRESSISGDA
jgi:hypothetical protein